VATARAVGRALQAVAAGAAGGRGCQRQVLLTSHRDPAALLDCDGGGSGVNVIRLGPAVHLPC
jgi:hypothetical protein